MKRIFIGGMGRSGTTIILNALYNHPKINAIPIETKFLVENDGFYDLIRALTNDYSSAATPIAIERFTRLMRLKVTGIMKSSFNDQHALSSNIFCNYEEALDVFIETIIHRTYYDNRVALISATRQFIATLFDTFTLNSDKFSWAEKTPANYWRVNFLRELFPDSYFIHCIRDPRLILLSLIEKKWLPQNIEIAVLTFESMIRSLVIKRRYYLTLPRYYEINLEYLVSHTSESLSFISSSLEIDEYNQDAINNIKNTIKNYYINKINFPFEISLSEKNLINQTLMPWILELGYPPSFPLLQK
jgi:hypothetical protein